MNLDEKRLKEIQGEKRSYHALLKQAESISECITYKARIDELDKEEIDILKRCDALWVK